MPILKLIQPKPALRTRLPRDAAKAGAPRRWERWWQHKPSRHVTILKTKECNKTPTSELMQRCNLEPAAASARTQASLNSSILGIRRLIGPWNTTRSLITVRLPLALRWMSLVMVALGFRGSLSTRLRRQVTVLRDLFVGPCPPREGPCIALQKWHCSYLTLFTLSDLTEQLSFNTKVI
jgi:hypothetical protein